MRDLPIYVDPAHTFVLYLCEDIMLKDQATLGACLFWSTRTSNEHLRYKLTPLISAARKAVSKIRSMRVREIVLDPATHELSADDQAVFGLNKRGGRAR